MPYLLHMSGNQHAEPSSRALGRGRVSAFADIGRVRLAITEGATRADILRAIGVTLSAYNYEQLERVAGARGLTLPPVAKTGRKHVDGQPRRSVAWDENRLRDAVANARSKSEVLSRLGLTEASRRILASAAAFYGVELPDGKGGPRFGTGHLADLRADGPFIEGQRLRRFLVEFGLLPDLCSECGATPVWMGKTLILQTDHINGVRNDNRIENLRILCPNCHSQTETFAGRNVRRLQNGAS